MFIDVILPLPVPSPFTYQLPDNGKQVACVGQRVIVPFGARKMYTGIIVACHKEAPAAGFEIKEAIELLDTAPIVLPNQLTLWQWMAHYYICTVGDVLNAALPSGLKLTSETYITPDRDFNGWKDLTKEELDTYDRIVNENIKTVSQLQKKGKNSRVLALVSSLMDKKAIFLQEEISSKYKPKQEIHVRMGKDYRTEQALQSLADQLGKFPKRYNLLMKYLDMACIDESGNPTKEVSKKALLEASGISNAILSAMLAKGYMETYNFQVNRISDEPVSCIPPRKLSSAQQTAFNDICHQLESKQVCLLHGVTSCGKTEIYIHLIQQQLEQGKQVLYLLPEIALTTQITERLKLFFGNQLGVYHSKYSDNERLEIWKKQLSEQPYSIILGARSSLFLPYQNLGLVIVDEEHEPSYKQQDPAPRYNARDTAIVLASHCHARILLGTATPSMESYHNAQTGKYGYVSLEQRYGNVCLPEIRIVDIKDLMHRQLMKPPFSPMLEEEMRNALNNNQQIILFLNRRGYTPVLECRQCGWVPTCQFCDVSLTYHQEFHKMICHYCGTTYDVPRTCPNCGTSDMRSIGFGTEKIEEEVKLRFPQARTARLDLDSTRTRNAYERILTQFARQQTDILIGTQMVSKGLDFAHVHVVGILDADTMMTRPDFRAFERSYQLISQVAGRAGRRDEKGIVILQTRHPEYSVLRQITTNDYPSMYREQVELRQAFKYPPTCRLIDIYLKHKDQQTVADAAKYMASLLRKHFGTYILGPDRPVIAKVHMMYIRKIILKTQPEHSLQTTRHILAQVTQQLKQNSTFCSVNIVFDVDPL